MTTTPTPQAVTRRRLLVLPTAALVLLLAPTSYADPEHCGPTVEPAQAETLVVRIADPAGGLRLSGTTAVDVTVRRDGPGPLATTRLEGAHVSLRVRTGRVTSFVDGAVDPAGHARLAVTLDPRSPAGPAVLVADVWAEPTPRHGCQQVAREHGAAEMRSRVSG